MITENGMACYDFVSLDEQVHDAGRIDLHGVDSGFSIENIVFF